MPLCSEGMEGFLTAVRELRAFRAAYRTALEAWRLGVRDVVVPFGTWLMRVVHGARCLRRRRKRHRRHEGSLTVSASMPRPGRDVGCVSCSACVMVAWEHVLGWCIRALWRL